MMALRMEMKVTLIAEAAAWAAPSEMAVARFRTVPAKSVQMMCVNHPRAVILYKMAVKAVLIVAVSVQHAVREKRA